MTVAKTDIKITLLVFALSLILGVSIVHSFVFIIFLGGAILTTILILAPFKLIIYSVISCSLLIGYAIEIKLPIGGSGLWIAGSVIPIIVIANYISKKFIITNIAFEHKIYFSFLIYSLITILYPEGGEFSESVSFWAKIFNGFLFFYIGSMFLTSIEEQKKIPFLFVISLMPVFILSFPELMSGGLDSHRWIGGERVNVKVLTGGFYSARYLSFGIVVALPFILLGINYFESKTYRMLFVFFLVISLYLMYYTFRRTAWAGSLTIILIWFLYFTRDYFSKRPYILILIGFIVFSAMFSNFFFQKIGIHFYDSFKLLVNLNEALTTARFDGMWTGRWGFFRLAYINTLLEQPFYYTIFGRGMGSTVPLLKAAGFVQAGGHSNYFVLLMDFGLIGFALYIGLIIAILKKTIFIIKYNSEKFYKLYALSSFSLICAYLVMSLVEHLIWHLVQFNWLFWIILSANIPIYSCTKRELNPKKEKISVEPLCK